MLVESKTVAPDIVSSGMYANFLAFQAKNKTLMDQNIGKYLTYRSDDNFMFHESLFQAIYLLKGKFDDIVCSTCIGVDSMTTL